MGTYYIPAVVLMMMATADFLSGHILSAVFIASLSVVSLLITIYFNTKNKTQ